MAFDIPKIEDYKFYIDVAFKRAQKIQEKNQKKKNLKKIEEVRNSITKSLERIMKKFPQIDELEPFYLDLFKSRINYGDVKQSLGAVRWASNKVKFFHKKYMHIIRKNDEKRTNMLRKEYYGRINSVLKQIRDDLKFLDEVRIVIRKFPVIKTGMKTCCIIGFPNAGKTTLLYKLTGSKGEIKPYAFTTKGINISYMNDLQLLDTPGTLNRKDKMNNIELVSYYAIKHLADFFIFVFDPTMDVEMQNKLYRKIKKERKKIYCYLSKTDLVENTEDFKKYDCLSKEEISKVISEMVE